MMKQEFLLGCLVLSVNCRHQYQSQDNTLWVSDASKEYQSDMNSEFESEMNNFESKFEEYEEELRHLADQPFFARVNNRTVVRPGDSAYLPCRVKFIQQGYMVTWLRTSDSTVLSVGADTFSSDTRLSVVHVFRPQINADDWTLIINKTDIMDTGRYECSVNTLPKISHTVDLVVEDEVMDMVMQDSPDNWSAMWHEKLQATIQGPKIQYVSEGSTVALQCSIPHVHSPPHSLYWTRDGHVFTAKDRPGISLESEKVVSESTSKLFISHVRLSDSANYTCVSDISKPDSVQLVVTKAIPGYALMFHNNSSQLRLHRSLLDLVSLSFICLLSLSFH